MKNMIKEININEMEKVNGGLALAIKARLAETPAANGLAFADRARLADTKGLAFANDARLATTTNARIIPIA